MLSKKTLLFFILVFLSTLIGVFLWSYIQEKKSLAYFYLNFSGGQAEIYLNHKKIGSPPIKNYIILGGWYELKIITPYYNYTTPLRLTPQTATIVDWQAGIDIQHSSGIIYETYPLGQDKIGLEIVTMPDRALMQIDQQTEKFFSPLINNDLKAGEHQLNLDLPGYEPLFIPFTLHQGYYLKLTVKLAQNQ